MIDIVVIIVLLERDGIGERLIDEAHAPLDVASPPPYDGRGYVAHRLLHAYVDMRAQFDLQRDGTRMLSIFFVSKTFTIETFKNYGVNSIYKWLFCICFQSVANSTHHNQRERIAYRWSIDSDSGHNGMSD